VQLLLLQLLSGTVFTCRTNFISQLAHLSKHSIIFFGKPVKFAKKYLILATLSSILGFQPADALLQQHDLLSLIHKHVLNNLECTTTQSVNHHI
jgi:hypothetical protein